MDLVASEAIEMTSVSKAAQRLGLSDVRVRQLCNEGRIRCVRTVIGRLLHVDDVEQLAAERAARQQQIGESAA